MYITVASLFDARFILRSRKAGSNQTNKNQSYYRLYINVSHRVSQSVFKECSIAGHQ